MRLKQALFFKSELEQFRSSSNIINRKIRVLELGSGDGSLLHFLISHLGDEFEFYGIDYSTTSQVSNSFDYSHDINLIRLPNLLTSYPFDSDFFDFIFSNQVLEHVQTISFLLSELSRVLHPSGVSLHLYPRKRIIVEPHCNIPLVHHIPNRFFQSIIVFCLYDIFNFYKPGFTFRSSRRREFSKYISTQTFYRSSFYLAGISSSFGLVIFYPSVNSYMQSVLPIPSFLNTPLPLGFLSFVWSFFKSSVLYIRF